MHRHEWGFWQGLGIARCENEDCSEILSATEIERRLNDWEDFERLKKKYDALEREVLIMVSGPWDGHWKACENSPYKSLIAERQEMLEYMNEEVGTEHLPEEWQIEGE